MSQPQQPQQPQQYYHRYGQVVVGPCGSGKTTYCDGMQQYLQLLGRNAVVVNLDPANNHFQEDTKDAAGADAIETDPTTDPTSKGNGTNTASASKVNTALPYTPIYDVCVEAVNLKSVMQQMQLGPNGALIYCMEYIELHANEIIDTILTRSSSLPDTTINNNNIYYIFDLPGQIELYTHSTCIQTLLQKLTSRLQMKLVAVQLIDSLYCTDVTKFISAALLGTTTMIRLELPTINILSKVDMLASYGSLPLQLDYYTECCDLERLIPFLYETNISTDEAIDTTTIENEDEYDIADDVEYQRIIQKRHASKFAIRYEKLHRALAEIVEDYSLLSFVPLDITDAESVGRVVAKIDKCNGYVFTNEHKEQSIQQDLFQCAVQHGNNNMYESMSDIRERMTSPESIRELRLRK
jgi:GPN-loop GTPase